MANPTTNFGWVMPTSTSLVTNLPADFNTFGQGVDTSMAQLKGGTTGQVLSKTSGTDMAFTWVTPTDQTPLTTKGDLFAFSTVDARLAVGANETRLVADSTQTVGLKYVADTTNYAINAKADLLVGTAADTLAALAVGTNNQVLTADSSTATGLKWATASSGSQTLLSTTSLSGTSTTISSIASGYRALYIYGRDIKVTSGTAYLRLRWNGFTNGYYGNAAIAGAFSTYQSVRFANAGGVQDDNATRTSLDSSQNCQFYINFPEYTATGFKLGTGWFNPSYSEDVMTFAALNDGSTAAITSFAVTTAAGTASMTGTIYVYGVN